MPASSLRAGVAATCDELTYDDTIFYYGRQREGRFEKPQKGKKGSFGAFPAGLDINPVTGAIDVNKSESGMKYRVWFKPNGSTDTCSTYITISGINYVSRVYNLAKGDSIAAPFYNASLDAACPCAKSAQGCEFNSTDDLEIMSVARTSGRKRQPVEVAMDPKTGAINLRKTLRNGLLGAKPKNGSIQEFRLYYRLDDASHKAVNYIDIRIHYYDRIENVPASLLAQTNYKTAAGARIATLSGGTYARGAVRSESGGEGGTAMAVRPPDVIGTGF
ncbi:MAG: hypothetical protein EAZ91_11860 [Cytophagales bacterium]|nr:MAG: hypothetical protein EAZ91_11860 [Cytophagales bacterium]